jgi:hypothetical protein
MSVTKLEGVDRDALIKQLGPEIVEGPLERVFDFLDLSSSVRFCLADKELATNLKNEHFWSVLLARDFGSIPSYPGSSQTAYKTHNFIVNQIMAKPVEQEIDYPEGAPHQIESFHFVAAVRRSLAIENEERRNSCLEKTLARFERYLKIEENRLEAEKRISEIKDPNLKDCLSIIIQISALTEHNSAKKALRKAEKNALLITDETIKNVCLKIIAQDFLRFNNFTEANRILKRIAQHYLSKNLLKVAERIALGIPDNEEKDSILKIIAWANIKGHHLVEAERVTLLISDNRKKSFLLRSIVNKYLKSHNPIEAERVADLIPDLIIRLGSLSHIMPFYKRAGRWIKNNPKYTIALVLLQSMETLRNYLLGDSIFNKF